MFFTRWLRSLSQCSARPGCTSGRHAQTRRSQPFYRPILDWLEDRRLLATLPQLPLAFEANHGQVDAQVEFLARGTDYSIFLTPGAAVLSLLNPAADSAAIRMELVGSHPNSGIGGALLPGVSNYLVGNDPSSWRTGIPNYSQVVYDDVYAGIDLIYYGTAERRLEYDFVIAPGADPGAIGLAFSGIDGMQIDADGNLLLQTAAGTIRHLRPVVYQEAGGVRQQVDHIDPIHILAVGTIPVTVPAGARGGATMARFRVSSMGGLGPTGIAPDGEVEDHQVTIRIESPIRASFEASAGRLTIQGTNQADRLEVAANNVGRLQIFDTSGNRFEIPIFDAVTALPLDPASDAWPTAANTRVINVSTRGGDDGVSVLDDRGLLAGIEWTITTGDGADHVNAQVVGTAAGSFLIELGAGDDMAEATIGYPPTPIRPGPASAPLRISVLGGAGDDEASTVFVNPPDPGADHRTPACLRRFLLTCTSS